MARGLFTLQSFAVKSFWVVMLNLVASMCLLRWPCKLNGQSITRVVSIPVDTALIQPGSMKSGSSCCFLHDSSICV